MVNNSLVVYNTPNHGTFLSQFSHRKMGMDTVLTLQGGNLREKKIYHFCKTPCPELGIWDMFPQEWVWMELPRIGQSKKSRGPGEEPQYFKVGQEDKPTRRPEKGNSKSGGCSVMKS